MWYITRTSHVPEAASVLQQKKDGKMDYIMYNLVKYVKRIIGTRNGVVSAHQRRNH